MSKYAEVPEVSHFPFPLFDASNRAKLTSPLPFVLQWAYLALTVFAIVIGCIALTVYPTNASVSCIFFGSESLFKSTP
jgi:hypothetical protein